MIEFLFWFLVVLILYVYFGYSLLLLTMSKLRPGLPVQKADITPTISLIIPAYNEEKVIAKKIENALALDYPREKLEITVTSDASTDQTNTIVRHYADKGVKLVAWTERRGKTAMLNRVVPAARGEIVVFTDANALFASDALRRLVRNFADPSVGGAGGAIHFVNQEDSGVAVSEGLFVRYERMLRQAESDLGVMTSTMGAIYAIRKQLFKPIDDDLADDFAVPLEIVSQGYRIVQDNDAVASERTCVTGAEEFRRKVRIVARDSRAYLRYRGMLSPQTFKIAAVLFSHKLFRWLVSVMLIGTLVANVCLVMYGGSWFYVTTLVLQALLYGLALLGLGLESRGVPVFVSVPYFFVMVNLAALVGLWFNLSGQQTATWHRAETTR